VQTCWTYLENHVSMYIWSRDHLDWTTL
jgi:hypothetical protein